MTNEILNLVGFRGTLKEIEAEIESIVSSCDLVVDKSVNLFLSENDNAIDLNYMFTIDNEYDFDLFVIETREKRDGKIVFYITEITDIS